MKPEKKTSAAKKKVASSTNSTPEKAAGSVKKTKAAAESSPATPKKKTSTTRKVVEKVVEVAETATKAGKRVAAKVKKAAETAAIVGRQVRATAKKPLAIPSILLEGDRPSAVEPAGPGQKFALGPTPPIEDSDGAQELPEAYGTKRLFIAARDPQWLYANWDLTAEQRREYNGQSADGHLVVRVYKNDVGGEPHTEVHVHPESRNWFIHVGDGGTKYRAELGFYDASGKWSRISVSSATLTPPDRMSDDTSVRFATIPVDVPFEELIRLVKAAVSDNVPLAEAIQQLRADGFKKLPEPKYWASARWTPEQEQALATLVTMDSVRRLWIGSLEITELVRRQLQEEVSSMAAAQFSLPSSISLGSLSSPFGGAGEKRKGFWFNVNAELIIYGATEPDATVTIGGRRIKLRADGTFSYRFILPDGNYDLPAQATSADGDDTRAARLRFMRNTEYRGDVGAHPQDANMRPPLVEHVS